MIPEISDPVKKAQVRTREEVHQSCDYWGHFIYQVYAVYIFSTRILWSAPLAGDNPLVVFMFDLNV